MQLLRTKPVVEALIADSVSAEERAKYLLASFLVFNAAYYSGLVVAGAELWTPLSLMEAAVVVALNIVGVVKTFDAAGGKTNTDFIAQFTCLYVPVSVTTLVAVWGVYWLMRMSFTPTLVELSRSNMQFALNLASLGTDLLGFLAFVANVGVLAITYGRLHKLLARVREAREA